MNARNQRLLGLLAAIGLLGGGAFLMAEDPKTEPAKPAKPAAAPVPKPFKPAQDVARVMESQEAMVRDIKDGILEKEWESAETSAWILAELANVNHYHSQDAKYQGLADTMSTQCVELAKTLRKRKTDEAKTQMTAITQTCTSCHDQFAKKW